MRRTAAQYAGNGFHHCNFFLENCIIFLCRKAICVQNPLFCAAEEDRGHEIFEAVPDELFSPLASPNRALYADALDVLYTAYREKLKLPEDMLYSMLRSRLEQQLAEATFEGEDIDEDELRDISGRARFLIRKLGSKAGLKRSAAQIFGNTLRFRVTAAVCSSCSTRCARTRLHAAIRMCSALFHAQGRRMSRTTCMTKWLLSTAHMTTRARSSTCCR